jgi:hypothetical protein
MDNYALTLRAPADDTSANSYAVFIGDIKRGQYKAVFKMLGMIDAGYLSVRWQGLTNYANSRQDGKVIACTFGSYDYVYTGTLYVTDPESQITLSWYAEDDSALAAVKPIVSVELVKLN